MRKEPDLCDTANQSRGVLVVQRNTPVDGPSFGAAAIKCKKDAALTDRSRLLWRNQMSKFA